MQLHYTKDANGQDILCDVDTGKHQVMMGWEKNYMKKCIEILNPRNKVLEIGFGMGFSAHAIVTNPNVREYTVIECSPEVWEKFYEFKEKFEKDTICKINLIKGRWEDVLHTCGRFDSCFFDDYNYDNDKYRFLKFVEKFMKNNANIGSQLCVFSNSEGALPHIPYCNVTMHKVYATIPDSCRYAAGGEMKIPLLTKISNDIQPMRMTQEQEIPQIIKTSSLVVDNFFEFPLRHLQNCSDKNFGNFRVNNFQIKTFSPETHHEVLHTGNTWTGILFMTPNAPPKAGLEIVRFAHPTMKPPKELFKDNHAWIISETMVNIFNRLILINKDTYYRFMPSCQNMKVYTFKTSDHFEKFLF